MAVRDEFVISRSRTLRSRRALAASSFICSIEWPALVGLWSSEGTSSVATPATDGSSSGVETGREAVIRFSGIVGEGAAGSSEEPLDIRRGAIFDSAKSALAERMWLIARCPLSMLPLRDATMLFADCPRPCACGRVTKGEGSNGVPRSDDMDAC
jgi:hypothetical protein